MATHSCVIGAGNNLIVICFIVIVGLVMGIGRTVEPEDIHCCNSASPPASLHLDGHSLLDLGCCFKGQHEKEAGESRRLGSLSQCCQWQSHGIEAHTLDIS